MSGLQPCISPQVQWSKLGWTAMAWYAAYFTLNQHENNAEVMIGGNDDFVKTLSHIACTSVIKPASPSTLAAAAMAKPRTVDYKTEDDLKVGTAAVHQQFVDTFTDALPVRGMGFGLIVWQRTKGHLNHFETAYTVQRFSRKHCRFDSLS